MNLNQFLKTGFLSLGFFLLLPKTILKAQSVQFDAQVPSTPLNEKTKLTVLNSRLGSRFSLSYVAQEKGFHCGALGFDNDDHLEMLVAVQTDHGTKMLRTGALPENGKFFEDQRIRLGMTGMCIEGTQKGNLEVKFTIVSPFTPSKSLDETAAIQLATAPVFYLQMEVKNISAQPFKGAIQLGLKATPFDRDKEVNFSWWRRGGATQTLFFKDRSLGKAIMGLVAISGKTNHFELEGYNGLNQNLELSAGQSKIENFALVTHFPETVIQDTKENLPLHFNYTTWWKNVDDVVQYAVENATKNLEAASRFEQVLIRSKASPEEKWVTSISFHTDIANTFLLKDEKGKVRFYETEGRFRHLNTIDVAHETELVSIFIPWRLKLLIEQWTDYLATKEIMVPSSRSLKGIKDNLEGVSASELGQYLYHDVGNYPFLFKGEGYDFGPFMPVEENTNIVFLTYWYWKISKDDAFVKRHLGLIESLLHSLKNRDSDNSGIADYGVGWSSYDVSDAIKRSPENVYLGVKQMTAYILASELFRKLQVKATSPKNIALKTQDEDGNNLDGNGKAQFERSIIDNTFLRNRQAAEYYEEAEKIFSTLKKAQKKYGYLPVSLDEKFTGWNQHSILIGEGLFYPGLAGCKDPLLDKLAALVKPSFVQALEKSKTTYGIKLSSEEEPTWFSKIMVMDFVAGKWFGMNLSNASFAYQWNKNNNQAFQDGAFSDVKPWPGNWYPRGISSLSYLFKAEKMNPEQTDDFLKGL